MLIKDVIRLVDKKNHHPYANSNDYLNFFNLLSHSIDWDDFNAAVDEYWIKTWLCTDTWVGYKVIYLHGEPVATSCKLARKSDLHIFFLSKEHAEKMYSFLISLIKEDYRWEILGEEDEWPFDKSSLDAITKED